MVPTLCGLLCHASALSFSEYIPFSSVGSRPLFANTFAVANINIAAAFGAFQLMC